MSQGRTVSKSGIAIVGLIGMCAGVVVLGSAMAVEQDTGLGPEGSQREAIRAMTAACPELSTDGKKSSGGKRQTWVTLASIPGLPGQQDSGAFALKISGKNKSTGKVSVVGGTTEVTEFPARSTHATATALAGLAPGSIAGRTTQDRQGEGQGLSSSQCVQPSSRAWIVGAGTLKGQRDRVILINPTDSDTVVSLDIYDENGQVNATGTDGITVRAGEREEVQLDAIVSGAEALAVKVKTEVGLISAFIADERMQNLTPRGTEVIVETGGPRKRPVIAGLPAGTGERRIVLFAPSRDGNVRLRALTAKGPVDLADGRDIQMRAGRVRVLNLTADLNDQAASIEVLGDVPILATANMSTKESPLDSASRESAVADAKTALKKAKGAAAKARATQRLSDVKAANADAGSDIMWLSAGDRLPHLGVATAVLPQTNTKVSVAALDGDVDVKVSILGSKQKPGELGLEHEVTVASDTSRDFRIKSGSKSTYSVVVERVAGPGRLYASHHQTGSGRSITGYSLLRLAPRVSVPAAEAVFGVPN